MVLSYQYWTTRFASDPSVVGQKILINNYPMTIVGVSAAGFLGLDPANSPQIRVPIQMKPLMTPGWDALGDRRSQWIQMFARMKPGYTVQTANASLQPLLTQILRQELEMPEMRDTSQYNRVRFLARKVRMEAGGQRILGAAPECFGGADRVDVHGGAGAADRLLQRGEPADCAGGGAAEGDRGAAGGGSVAPAVDGPTADRKPDAFDCRRGGGAVAFGDHGARAAGLFAFERRAADASRRARFADSGLQCGAGDSHRVVVRHGSGAAIHAAGFMEHAEGRGGVGERHRNGGEAAQGPGDCAGGFQLSAAGGRGTVRAHAGQSEGDQLRL